MAAEELGDVVDLVRALDDEEARVLLVAERVVEEREAQVRDLGLEGGRAFERADARLGFDGLDA